MTPPHGRNGLQLAGWIVVVSLFLLPFLERNSAEFYITGFCLAAGLIFGAVVFLMVRRSGH